MQENLLKYGPIDKHDITLQNNIMLQTPTLKSTHNPQLPPSIVYEDNADCIVLATELDQNQQRTHWY